MPPSFAELAPEEQAARLHALARYAVALWPLQVVRIEPLKVRENAVYAVHTSSGQRAVLRVHRLGYHRDAALESEFTWLQALAAAGVEVPHPIRSRRGRSFELIEFAGVPGPRQVDVLEWIEGEQLGAIGQSLGRDSDWVEQVYGLIGEVAAAMHNQACAWRIPAHFERHAWDVEALVGEQPLWGRFWDLEALTHTQREFFLQLRARLRGELLSYGTSAQCFGLIHADLVPENILVAGAAPRIIDFDDAGFGWHMFELATTLYFIRHEPFYPLARDALIAGYRRCRPLDEQHLRLLPLFLAARGTTYLGWVHTRRGEAVARELTPQLIELALAAGEEYLAH